MWWSHFAISLGFAKCVDLSSFDYLLKKPTACHVDLSVNCSLVCVVVVTSVLPACLNTEACSHIPNNSQMVYIYMKRKSHCSSQQQTSTNATFLSNHIMLTLLLEAEGLPRGFEVPLRSLCLHLCVGHFLGHVFWLVLFPQMVFPSVHVGMWWFVITLLSSNNKQPHYENKTKPQSSAVLPLHSCILFKWNILCLIPVKT